MCLRIKLNYDLKPLMKLFYTDFQLRDERSLGESVTLPFYDTQSRNNDDILRFPDRNIRKLYAGILWYALCVCYLAYMQQRDAKSNK